MTLLDNLINIDPSKECLRFLADRVSSDDYRGMQISQHNRYNVEMIQTMVKEIYNLVGNGCMDIRTTDLSKRPYNYPNEKIYAEYVNVLLKKFDRCTQDSVRKNFFVDIHRMGFINRINEKGEKVGPYDRSPIKKVSLTNLGIDFAMAEDLFSKNFFYTKAIDSLTHGLANDLLDIVLISGNLTELEFMYFVSFLNITLNNKVYTRTDIVALLNEYRSLSKFQKNAVDDILQKYCDPKNFNGNKTDKRDYHNWKNETQQIFMLMDQTVLYERYGDKLKIRIGPNSMYEDETKLKRSQKEKDKYFENHHLQKKLGFELHHIIPLLMATSRTEFSTLDVWQNMIYIDGYTHSKISQTSNKNIKLDFLGDNILLESPSGIAENIECEKDSNVSYDTYNKKIMKEFNEKILNHF